MTVNEEAHNIPLGYEGFATLGAEASSHNKPDMAEPAVGGTSASPHNESRPVWQSECEDGQAEPAPEPALAQSTKSGVSDSRAVDSSPMQAIGSHRTVLLFTLIPAALLLILGPGTYVGLSMSQVDLAELYRSRNHRATELLQEQSHREVDIVGQCRNCGHSYSGDYGGALLMRDRQFSRDVVRSSINGLLIMVANVLSGIGADLSGTGIFAMGISNLVANGFSVAYSRWLMDSSREDFEADQFKREWDEVRNQPQEEIDEMICRYKSLGLSEQDAQTVAATLSKYEDFWVRHMMAVELGVPMPKGREYAWWSGLMTFLSFVCCGMVPVLGVTVPLLLAKRKGPQFYRPQFSTVAALGISAFALVFMGVALSRVSGSRATVTNSLLLLISGCCVSMCSFGLGQFCLSVGGKLGAGIFLSQAPEHGDSMSQDSGGAQDNGSTSKNDTISNNGRSGEYSDKIASIPDGVAWPLFRHRFNRGMTLLLCTILPMIILFQAPPDTLRVFAYGMLTCITTGFGAVPFMFVGAEAVSEVALAVANTVASGMMISASLGMLLEAHGHSGPYDWQLILGLIVGVIFMVVSQHMLGEEEEAGVEGLHSALVEKRHWRKAMLIFTVMFCHSAAEGIAVGVAFDRNLLNKQFGLYISILLAVHNMPEGLAVALVLVPRGISAPMAALIATLTSIPQPLLAVVAFLFVDAFNVLLPVGLSFAAGAMVYVSLHELLSEAAQQLGQAKTFSITAGSCVLMGLVQVALQWLTDS